MDEDTDLWYGRRRLLPDGRVFGSQRWEVVGQTACNLVGWIDRILFSERLEEHGLVAGPKSVKREQITYPEARDEHVDFLLRWL